jgi:hypothetical protein
MISLDDIEGKTTDEVVGIAWDEAVKILWCHYREAQHREGKPVRKKAHEVDHWSSNSWSKALGRNPPPSAQVAIRCLRHLESLENAGNDPQILFGASFWLGYNVHELLAQQSDRSSEKSLEAHGRLREGGRQGANKTNKKHIERQPKYQAEVDQRMDAGETYTDATDQVADSHGVSGRTVRSHTVNTRPHNRGGRRRKAK